jgi:outer membrane protein assembly factor BamB
MAKISKYTLPLAFMASFGLILAACDTFKEKIPLSGKREAVLSIDTALLPDSGAISNPVIVPPQERNKDWPQVGGNPSHLMPNLVLPTQLSQAWATNVGYGTSEDHRLTSGPVVGDGRVYICDAMGKVFAVSVKDGQILWSVDSLPEADASEAMGGGVAYDNGVVYCATSFGELVAIQALDGKILWRKSLGAPSRIAPTIKDGRVYALNINNEIHAFTTKGDALWNHAGISEAAGILGGASPAVGEGVVVATYSSGEVFAFDVNNGEPAWGDLLNPALRIDSVASIAHIRARPIICGGVVYVISHGGQMVAQDLRTGSRLWQREIGGIRTPAVMGDTIFAISNEADLIAIKKPTGQIHWAVPLTKTDEHKKPILWAGPVVAGDSLILTSSHGKLLFASPKDGKVIKILDMPSGSSLSPIVADGALYVLTDGGTLVKYAQSSEEQNK